MCLHGKYLQVHQGDISYIDNILPTTRNLLLPFQHSFDGFLAANDTHSGEDCKRSTISTQDPILKIVIVYLGLAIVV